jgi:NitT/TauT family transport system ATP-binding protein
MLQHVGYAYLGRTVLDRVDLSVDAGEMLALVGPSGSGKSTLAHLAAGLAAPQTGRVVRGYARHGMVFQEPRLMPWRNARGNIAYALRRQGFKRGARRARVDAVARRVSLGDADLAKYPAELSGGMKQRVAIARALAPAPDFVVFDEPFTGLDVALKRRMQNLVLAEASGASMAGLFITHDLLEAARISDRIAVLHHNGYGILGTRPVPGKRGTRQDDDLYRWVQERLGSDPIFRHIEDVDERQTA